MKSREILSLEDRYVIQLNPANSELLTKCWKALQIAEAEIEEKDKRIKELEDLGDEAFHEERYIDALGTIQNRNAQIVSKDKEIAELKEELQACSNLDFIRSNEYKERLSEISSLKEEVERLSNQLEHCNNALDHVKGDKNIL